MLILVALVPFYVFLPELLPPSSRYRPEVPLDRALPLLASWAFVYGALYLFLILLPIVVVRQEEHIRRTVRAYLLIWLTSYVFFVVYPTVAPRPAGLVGEGFGMWGLRALYGADPPYNCFPSLHVAHSFVSALTCGRVHRGVGATALTCAVLVSVSTLFTKQHYVVDVIAGVILAVIAYALFLRRYSREQVSAIDRSAAPALALCVFGMVAIGVLASWLIYSWSGAVSFQIEP